MSSKLKITVSVLAIIIFIAGMGYVIYNQTSKPGEHDQLAQCLTDKGAKFYGAFWCPHCQKQKAMFGNSARLLPYTECSTPDGKSQMQVCKDAGVESYPTWLFADGSKLTGEIALATLAEKTDCSVEEVAAQ